MGGLRFKSEPSETFLGIGNEMPIPPFHYIRTLEEASLQLEKADNNNDPNANKWLTMLIAPGSSLGGARPKASIMGTDGDLWIAKFPSRNDQWNVGAWEQVTNEMAVKAGVNAAEGKSGKFSDKWSTYLTRRFDRDHAGRRIHFASAMTLLGKTDGADAGSGASYLDIADFIIRHGASPNKDLEELWRQIVFNICVSNSDDHLRNHGFLLTSKGWALSPAYDMNPVPGSTGLTLNISEYSNELSLDLAREVAPQFRIGSEKQQSIIEKIHNSISGWKEIAGKLKYIPFRDCAVGEFVFNKLNTASNGKKIKSES